MNVPTERQRRRRGTILSVARELIAERGYEAVTMRDLALRSGVAPQTLYDNYASKDNLLARALEEHFMLVARKLEEESRKYPGIERLLQIIGRGADIMLANSSLMQVLGALIPANPREYLIHGFHLNWHRGALVEALASGGLVKGTNADFLAEAIARHLMSILFYWAKGEIPARQLKDSLMWAASNLLLFPSRGATRRMIISIISDTTARLAVDSESTDTSKKRKVRRRS